MINIIMCFIINYSATTTIEYECRQINPEEEYKINIENIKNELLQLQQLKLEEELIILSNLFSYLLEDKSYKYCWYKSKPEMEKYFYKRQLQRYNSYSIDILETQDLLYSLFQLKKNNKSYYEFLSKDNSINMNKNQHLLKYLNIHEKIKKFGIEDNKEKSNFLKLCIQEERIDNMLKNCIDKNNIPEDLSTITEKEELTLKGIHEIQYKLICLNSNVDDVFNFLEEKNSYSKEIKTYEQTLIKFKEDKIKIQSEILYDFLRSKCD